MFKGVANFVMFDDIAFGSAIFDDPGDTVFEPANWTPMITGFGLVGDALRRRGVALAVWSYDPVKFCSAELATARSKIKQNNRVGRPAPDHLSGPEPWSGLPGRPTLVN